MKRKVVRAKTGWEFIQLMKRHNCSKGKLLVSDDDPPNLLVGYKCEGCGWRVCVDVGDLKKEKECLELLWKAVKTAKGRRNLGHSLS